MSYQSSIVTPLPNYTMQEFMLMVHRHTQLVVANPASAISTYIRFEFDPHDRSCQIPSYCESMRATHHCYIHVSLTEECRVFTCKSMKSIAYTYQMTTLPLNFTFTRFRQIGLMRAITRDEAIYQCATCPKRGTSYRSIRYPTIEICHRCMRLRRNMTAIDMLFLLSNVPILNTVREIRIYIVHLAYYHRS